MAHMLTYRQNGFVEMAYRGLMPWHGLGQLVKPDASIDDWRKAAGLDWEIMRSTVQFQHGQLHTFPSHEVLYRSDTSAPLSVCTPKYKIVQPSQVLEFFRSLTLEAGFQIETAGSLKGGRVIWVLARTGFEAEVVEGDNVKGYVLLTTSYDGQMATIVQFTSVRVVCANTLQMAMNGDVGQQVRVRHNTEFLPEVVKGELGLAASESFDLFLRRMQLLAGTKLSTSDFGNVVGDLLAQRMPVDRQKFVAESKGYQKIMGLFAGDGRGAMMESVAGTAWGGINAITQYVDHERRARDRENRLAGAWFGDGYRMKEEALNRLLEMA